MFTPINDQLAWEHIKRSRQVLFIYLSSLNEEQWNKASLSEDWLVRDVVAHLILLHHYTIKNSWFDFLLSKFKVNIFLNKTAKKLGKKSKQELLDLFEPIINEQKKTNSISVLNVLADVLLHEQDIRIPLNQPKAMPIDSLTLIFSHWEPTHFNFGEKITKISDRVKGLEFYAEDLGIRKGEGPMVSGKAQDILLSIAGRKIGIDNLRGDGAAILKNRLL